MATTITAGNATNGAAISSDNTGILELKTGTGAGTTAMALDASQNMGIGTSSPFSKVSVVGDQLIVAAGGSTAFFGVQIKGTALTAIPAAQVQGYIATGDSAIGTAGDLLIAPRTDVGANIRFITGTTPTERFRIGSAGQLGVAGANYGTAGQALVSNGASSAPSWQTVATAPDVQTFNSSGTWTKPSTGNFVRIQMWGGGSGGSRQPTVTSAVAGGGGGYYETTLPIASMGATATVTVGGGGAGRTGSAGNGTNGGNSGVTLGSGTTIYVSGSFASVGGAGGDGGYGALVFSTTVITDPTNIGKGAGQCYPMDGYSYTGGGGGSVTTAAGGKGGWGGGGGTYGTGAGGTSVFGGAGGNASTNGTQPGGGGGCSTAANTNGTNGAAGRVIITTF